MEQNGDDGISLLISLPGGGCILHVPQWNLFFFNWIYIFNESFVILKLLFFKSHNNHCLKYKIKRYRKITIITQNKN